MRKIGVKLALVAVFGLLLSLGLVLPAHADRLDDIKNRGTLLAGVDFQGVYVYKDSRGRVKGFEADIVNYIGKKLGVKVKFVPVDKTTRISGVADGTLDITAATMTHTKSRDAKIDYSVTYFFDGQKIMVKKGSGIKSYKDLAGKKVGSARGTTSERNIARVQPRAKVLGFKDFNDAMKAMEDGLVDAVSTDSTLLLGLKVEASDPNAYEIVGGFFADEPYGLGLPQDESAWRDFVNECLIEMWNSGQWEKTYNTYFGPGKKYELPLDFKMSTWPLR